MSSPSIIFSLKPKPPPADRLVPVLQLIGEAAHVPAWNAAIDPDQAGSSLIHTYRSIAWTGAFTVQGHGIEAFRVFETREWRMVAWKDQRRRPRLRLWDPGCGAFGHTPICLL